MSSAALLRSMRSSMRRKTPASPALALSRVRSSRMKLMMPEMISATAMARSPRMGVTTWMSSHTSARRATRSPVYIASPRIPPR
jgi:hypothetical protein